MTHPIQEKIERIRNDRTLPCTKPWTTLDERTVFGDFKVCCWLRTFIGRIPKTSSRDILDLWKGPEIRKVRKILGTPGSRVGSICPPSCGILSQREDYFNSVEFWDYDPAEYQSFSQIFRDNRERTLQGILERKGGGNTYPLRLKLFPSMTCNLNCRMCHLKPTYQVPVGKTYYRSVFKLMPYLEDLCIFGGEPFACDITKRFLFGPEIRKYPHLHFSTVTNGTLLDDRMQEKLRGLRLGWFNFSMDSCSEDTYKNIRRGASFSNTLSNLQRFIRRAHTGEINIRSVRVSFVIQKSTVQEIPLWVDLAHTLNVTPFFGLVDGSNELMDCIHDVRKNLEKALNKAESLSFDPAVRSLRATLNELPHYAAGLKDETLFSRAFKRLADTRLRYYLDHHSMIVQQAKKYFGR